MRKRFVGIMVMLGLATVISGGCANKEVVKAEEPVVAKAEPAKPEVKPEPPKPVAAPKEVPKQEEPKQDMSQKASAVEMNLETVYFDFDKSDIRQDAKDVLYKNAEILLKSKKEAKIKIEGHCDERGSAEYNLALGERRAKSALQYLLTLGVPAERLSTISYGKEKPAVDGHDEASWAKNRRAEFAIVK